MSLTTDRNDPRLRETDATGQHVAYLVLSDAERARGFVRPLRFSYKHVGVRPTYPVRALTPDEQERYAQYGYIQFEEYPGGSHAVGRYWTLEKLQSGCGTVTSMGTALAETYARDPEFYGATFCCDCGKHLPLSEFVWVDPDGTVTDQIVGS